MKQYDVQNPAENLQATGTANSRTLGGTLLGRLL